MHIKAGDGGNGCLSIRHEKHMPRGGDGGSVIFIADHSLNTLVDLNRLSKIKAQRAQDGSSNKRFGSKGQGIVIRASIGTKIRDKEFNLLLRDLKEHEKGVIVAHSDEKGRGNVHQSSATRI